MSETITVTSKGQVTLPAKIRKRMGITRGTRLKVDIEGNILKITAIPRLSELAGIDEALKDELLSRDVEKLRKEWDKEFERRTKTD